jgi:hypothetical protein
MTKKRGLLVWSRPCAGKAAGVPGDSAPGACGVWWRTTGI